MLWCDSEKITVLLSSNPSSETWVLSHAPTGLCAFKKLKISLIIIANYFSFIFFKNETTFFVAPKLS